MKTPLKALAVVALTASLLVLSSGCKQYKIEVTMNEDGSGTRTVKLTAPTLGDDNFEVSLEKFRTLFGLDEKRGWKMQREVKETEGGEKTEKYVFTLDAKAKRISSWQAMSGDIDVRGTLDKGPLEDVSFHNEIVVERDEGNVITYRETLSWKELKESVVALNSAFFRERLAEEYPFISDLDLDMIEDFLAGILTMVWYAEEVAEHKFTDDMYAKATAEYICYSIQEKYPDEDLSGLAGVIARIYNEEGEKYLDNMLKDRLPGAYLAGQTAIAFMVTMPGEIIETNASNVEGNTAVWKYDLMLVSFNHPVELFVKAKVKK